MKRIGFLCLALLFISCNDSNFKKGKEFFQLGDFETAKIHLQKVHKNKSEYKQAQELLIAVSDSLNAHKKREIDELVFKASVTPSSDLDKNFDIYFKLVKLDSLNSEFRSKLDFYTEKLSNKFADDVIDEKANKLASIDNKLSEVDEYRKLLKTIHSKTDDSYSVISEQTRKAQQLLLNHYGKKVSLKYILDNANLGIPESDRENITYAEAVAFFVVVHGKQ